MLLTQCFGLLVLLRHLLFFGVIVSVSGFGPLVYKMKWCIFAAPVLTPWEPLLESFVRLGFISLPLLAPVGWGLEHLQKQQLQSISRTANFKLHRTTAFDILPLRRNRNNFTGLSCIIQLHPNALIPLVYIFICRKENQIYIVKFSPRWGFECFLSVSAFRA